MRGISASTAGAMRNASAMYGAKGNGAYTSAAAAASRSGKSGMASHRAGLASAGLS